MTKKFLSLLLSLAMLLVMIPVPASAGGSDLGPRPLGEGEAYVSMTTSQNMVDMIKVFEGFRSEPYWDVNQWSIGYGMACGYEKDNKPDMTITEPEAAAELVKLLETNYGKTVNDYMAKIGKQPTQQQFDALVDFTYNLGGGWTSDDCRLTRWLEDPTNDLDLVDAMGVWCRVSGKISYPTVMRRIREAIVFLKGEYSIPRSPDYFETSVPVLSNHDLPYYKAGTFLGGGGTFGSKEDTVRFFRVGEPYGAFPTPSREGHELTGWNVVAVNDSNVDMPYGINTDAVVEKNLEIEAMWRAVETEPTDPTVPETTEPAETDPTVPETTAPAETEPTVPETTAPAETEPTVPETTEPAETEPTVPETTAPAETEPTVPETTAPAETEPTVPETTEPAETEPTDPEATEPEETEPAESEPTEPSEPEETEPEDSGKLPFRDVKKSDWFHDPVQFVYEHGYMSGTSSTRFSPNQSMTRGMLVTVLYAIDGKPEVTEEQKNAFVDTRNDYYTSAVAWAKANGIVSGVSDTRFAPNQKVTRQDAVAIFYKYCVHYKGLDGSASADLSGFTDARRVADYAVPAMKWAVAEKLVSGTTSGSGLALNPRGNLTRAESATIIRAMVTEILGNP